MGNQVNPHGQPRNIPASEAADITPDDVQDLPDIAYGIYVGVAGDVTVDLKNGGSNITFKNAVQGQILEIVATRVYATGTTATSLVALIGND